MEINWTLILQLLMIAVVIWLAVVQTRRIKCGSAESTPPPEDKAEMERLANLRAHSLSDPLNEKARPRCFSDIIGQQEGIRALEAALCGPNPQHVLLYGPPGIGKTCAARLVLEEAKRRPESPFNEASQFVEMDATCIRFDERAIADPLIGSVHDPIYQGAGALGGRGVPQPKPGAVTRAHCGVLFLDEIGELHPMQMNKLLKVLEDRRVRFESSYYSPDNKAIPAHIHDIFQNGLPADFRLIGATTRKPEELPPALRSRCVELHFRSLTPPELRQVAEGAAARAEITLTPGVSELCSHYAHSGRDAVNIVQLAAGIAGMEGRGCISENDVRWVARTCGFTPIPCAHLSAASQVGCMPVLAVAEGGTGLSVELECSAMPAPEGRGGLFLNGIVEEEELEAHGRKLRKKSTARGSMENVVCAMQQFTGLDLEAYEIRFNIPGGLPADGPSAGIAAAVALYSALSGQPPLPRLCATGEVTIHGRIRPVGGVPEKLAAAQEAGAVRVLIPQECDDPDLHGSSLEVVPVATLAEVLGQAFPAPAATVVSPAAFPAAADAPGKTERPLEL